MKKGLLAWLLLMAMLLTVGAVAAAETNPNAGLGYYPGTSEKGWISVECSTMSKMNPFLQTYSTEFSINRHIWDCLVKLSPEDNSIVPAAAESWESSEDGMNWTFHIRKGMKWVNSKGEVIGAAFDGNIHSLGGSIGYDGELNRTVSVSTAAITEALRNVYNQPRLLRELGVRR